MGDTLIDATLPKGTALNRRLKTWSERVEKVPFAKKAELYEKIGDAHMMMGIRQTRVRFASFIKKKQQWVAKGRKGSKPGFIFDQLQNKAEEAALAYRSALEASKKKPDKLKIKLALCNLSLSTAETRDHASKVSKTSAQRHLAILAMGDSFLVDQQFRKAIGFYTKASRGTPPAIQAYAFYRMGRAVQGIATANSKPNSLFSKVIGHYQNAVRRASVDNKVPIGTYLKNNALILAAHATASGSFSDANRFARSGFLRPVKFEVFFTMARKKLKESKPKEAIQALSAITNDAKRHHDGYLAALFTMRLANQTSNKQAFQNALRQMEVFYLQDDGYVSLFKSRPALQARIKLQLYRGFIGQLAQVTKRKKDQPPLITFNQYWNSSKRLFEIIKDPKMKSRLRRGLASFAVKNEQYLVAGDQYYELSKLVADNPQVRRGLLAASLTYWGRHIANNDIKRVVLRHADSVVKIREAIDLFIKDYQGDPKINTAKYLKVQLSLADGKDVSAVMKDAVAVMQAEGQGGLGSNIFLKTLNNLQKKQSWLEVIQLVRTQLKFYRTAKPKDKVEIGKILDRACSFLPKKQAIDKKLKEAASIANLCSRIHLDLKQQQKYIVEALKFARDGGEVGLAFSWGQAFTKRFPKHPAFTSEIEKLMDFFEEALFLNASLRFAQIGLKNQNNPQIKKKFQLALSKYQFALGRREQAKNSLINYFKQFGSDRDSLELAFEMGKQFEENGNIREAGRFYRILGNNGPKIDQAIALEVQARSLKLQGAKPEQWNKLYSQLLSRLSPQFINARNIVAGYYYRSFSNFVVNETLEPIPEGVDLRELDKIKRKIYDDSLKSLDQITKLKSPGFAQVAHEKASILYEAYALKIKKVDTKSLFAKNMSLTMLDRAKDHKKKAEQFAKEELGFIKPLKMPGPERIPTSRVVPKTVFLGFPNAIAGAP